MCFDLDSRAPILPIAGGSLESGELILTAEDGNQLSAFHARPARPTGTGVVILPDVRGLHGYYEDLSLRFAEHGIDAVAIDWFGRTAGIGRRGQDFDHAPHVPQTTWPGCAADISAGVSYLRSAPVAAVSVFCVGFCFGGRAAFLSGTLGLQLAGVVGFYGSPVGAARNGSPAPVDVAGRIASPLLGLFGGADEGIPEIAIEAFEAALSRSRVDHRLISYPGAPHSFFDRKADQFASSSDQAWSEVLAFVRNHAADDRTGDLLP